MAQDIRSAYAGGESQQAIADKYGLHRVTVGRVVRGATATAAGGPTTQNNVRWKIRCIRGHLLAETRTMASNCRTCNKIRNTSYRERMTRL